MSRYLETNKDAISPPASPKLNVLQPTHATKRVAWSIFSVLIAVAVAGTIGYRIMG